MSKYEFIKYIESIGFEYCGHIIYKYRTYRIMVNHNFYILYKDGDRIGVFYLNDLTQLVKFTRYYKLRKLLERI